MHALHRFLRRLRADRRGNLMLEFALAMPILFLMIVGLLDLGRFSLQKSALLQGAREGAQYGIIASTDSTNINSTAQNATGLTGVTATNLVFCECVSGTTVACTTSGSPTTCAGGATLKKYITVTTTATFSSVMGSATTAFGDFGSWTPPTSATASVTLIVP
jgi:Flp pilus assembly protein TadG